MQCYILLRVSFISGSFDDMEMPLLLVIYVNLDLS